MDVSADIPTDIPTDIQFLTFLFNLMGEDVYAYKIIADWNRRKAHDKDVVKSGEKAQLSAKKNKK